jgi:sugar phosphate isomerase/epimerase
MKQIALSILLVAMSVVVKAQPEIGLQLYSVRNQIPKDVPGTLDKIKTMGIRQLEGGDTYGMTIPEFQKMLQERGMTMVSIGADFEKLETNPASVIENALAWKVKYVVCYGIPHQNDNFTIDDTRRAIRVFTSAGKLLKEKGITLCYHPHGFEFRPYEKETLFDYLAKSLTSDALQFEMDVFWVKHPGQDPVALLKKYKGRFVLMHLKDRQIGTVGNQNGNADEETNVILGTGDVGIAEVMKAAKEVGVRHFFIEDESSRVLQQVPQSLSYLKSLK